MIILIIFITIIFVIYVEYSVGGILFRPNSLGNYTPNIGSLLNFMIDPLYNTFLWNIELLDVNYIFILMISIFINYMFNTT